MDGIKTPKSWKELNDENVQLRAALEGTTKMSDTKALDELLDDSNWTGWKFIFGNNVKCKNTFQHENTDLLDEAAAELVELKQRAALVDEDGCTNILAEFSAMRTENDKLRTDLGLIYSAVGAKTPTDTLVITQTALDEARKVIEPFCKMVKYFRWCRDVWRRTNNG
jgi:hypothetical protein